MGFVVALALFCALYNNVFNLLRPEGLYVPINLGVAALILSAATWWGLDRDEMGMSIDGLAPGMGWGGAIAGVIAVGLAAAYVLPGAQTLLTDQRAAGIGIGGLAYQALVRIPLGTVVLEEVAFRGVLFGAWQKVSGVGIAIIGSSFVFGLWHIVPALEMLRVNDFAAGTFGSAGFVLLAVIGTAAGGVVLILLRLLTGGIWAPMIVHAAANSFALITAFAAQR